MEEQAVIEALVAMACAYYELEDLCKELHDNPAGKLPAIPVAVFKEPVTH